MVPSSHNSGAPSDLVPIGEFVQDLERSVNNRNKGKKRIKI